MANTGLTLQFDNTDALGLEGRTGRKEVLKRVANFIDGIKTGAKRSSALRIWANGTAFVAASGTLTCASTAATNTFAINGVTFTGVASGATAVQFNIGATDTITATNIAATINASTNALVQYLVTATSTGAVVTVTAAQAGVTGNTITLAGTLTTLEASGVRLAGGTGGNVTVQSVTL